MASVAAKQANKKTWSAFHRLNHQHVKQNSERARNAVDDDVSYITNLKWESQLLVHP